MATTISDRVFGLCTDPNSVSALIASDAKITPEHAVKKLYHPETFSVSDGHPPKERLPATAEQLERAFKCGNWGPTRPSEQFLRVFHDSLLPLDHDPLMGVCSPSLLGTCGVVPLSIIGPLPDICRHMSNLIARAEKEVFLATNFWMDSDASALITDALKELSRRAGARGQRAVVKIIYDRADAKQVLKHHEEVPEKTYSGKKIRLPSSEEAPHLDMQVMNYHRTFLGTFHAKFMVVDRKIAVVSSNNIQDNDNVEMMCQYEGPIVDSLYDTLLMTWHNPLDPALPSRTTPAVKGGLPTFDETSFKGLFDDNGNLNVPSVGDARSLQQVADSGKEADLPLHAAHDPHYDPDIASEIKRMQSALRPKNAEDKLVDQVAAHLNLATHQHRQSSAPEFQPGEEFTPFVPHAVHELFPMAIVGRKPYGAINHGGVYVPQNEAFLSAVRNAREDVFIQSPDVNAAPLLPELTAAIKRGVRVTYYACLGYNDAGENLPRQGGHNEAAAYSLYQSLANADERSRLHVHYYVAKDQIKPIHNKFKGRSCHIKLMIVDGCIGIMGSGNQDTQTWYHSQEINVLVDSAQICRKWREGIDRNQNTLKYGAASQEDGVWRDADGHEAEGAIGKDAGKFAWAKGIVGAVQRVRGAGGF